MEPRRTRETERSRGSGHALGALGGVVLLMGTMAIATPFAFVLALTAGFGAHGTLVVLTIGIALDPAHAAVVAVLTGSTLLAVGAWLARDRPPTGRRDPA